MTSTDERVVVNGTRLHVRLDGPRDAPAVVLAHSLGTELSLWDLQVPALAARYRVVRYDARGHGQSDPPAGPITLDTLAGDLLGLIAHYRIAQAHLVGLSLGALTVLAAALRVEPAVKSIAVCDTRADVPPDFVRSIDERNTIIRAEGLKALTQSQPQKWLSPESVAKRPELVDRVRSMFVKTSAEGFIACTEAVKTSGLSARLGAIKLPALFVAADQDAGLPVEVMRSMAAQVEGSRFTIISGAGHLSNLEQPSEFNAALLAFLDDVSAWP